MVSHMGSSDLGPLDDGLQDLGLPVPVQTFLWGQIAPFIRPKLGKLHEATCMFCQHAPGHHELKEACKSFEKVLVQNIHFGLSIPFTSALESIGRWRLVQAALPHVMHCAAALLHNRVKDLQTLGTAETKLLYTLHWILLFASEECADEEMDAKKIRNKRNQPYLFSIPTISLFVYLFAPIAHHLKESDFQNFRLENGLRLWQGMWEYKAPGAPCFTAPVKPKARQILSPLSPRGSLVFSPRKPSETTPQSVDSPQSTSVSDATKHDDEASWVSSPKDCVFPETIPEEASSLEEERVVIFRLPASSNMMDQSFYTADASLLQQPQSRTDSSTTKHTTSNVDESRSSSRFNFDRIEQIDRGVSDKMKADGTNQPKTSSSTEKDSIDSHYKATTPKCDVTAATFLDVAVLRCLFISHWHEDGVYWCLHYMYNRLREMSEEANTPAPQPRRRSNSLPIPQIEISVYQGPASRDSPSGSGSVSKDFIEVPEPPPPTLLTDNAESPKLGRKSEETITTASNAATGSTVRRSSEKKRRVKMADLRTLIETRMFSKSDRTLERVGLESAPQEKPLEEQVKEYHSSLDTGEVPLNLLSREPRSNLVKGKSMPSLSCLLDSGYVEPPPIIRGSQSSGPRTTFFARNPIITVTEHTPTPSPEYIRRQGSFDSQLDALSTTGSGVAFRTQMLRSHTDSHIDYSGADESEAPGSSFYITREGGLDYEIVLLAVFSVFKRDSNMCSLRVLETGLNICELLIDLGVLKLGEHAHNLSMGITKRTLLHLGCPHGCNDGIRGPPAEFLRTQCQTILSRMLRQAAPESRRYLRNMVKTAQLHELIEFFHAFVGFCVDPSSLLSPLSEYISIRILVLTQDEYVINNI